MLLIPLLLVVACATNDYDDPQPEPRGERIRMRGNLSSDDELLPPTDWWHSPHIAEAVNLSAEQMQQLDQLQSEHGEEIARLARDLTVVSRDVRNAVGQRQATASDIVAAGDRVAALRDQLYRRRIALLAAERAVLTYEQWTALQNQMEERIERRRENFGPRMGGGGRRGGGGRGRRPGW